MQKYERRYIWTMTGRLLRNAPDRHPAIEDIFREIEQFAATGRFAGIWLDAARDWKFELPHIVTDIPDEVIEITRWCDLAEREVQAIGRLKPPALVRRIQMLQQLFDLDSLSASIVELLYLRSTLPPVSELMGTAERSIRNPARLIALLLDKNSCAVERRLASNSPLQVSGLIEPNSMSLLENLPQLSDAVTRLLSQPVRDACEARRVLLGNPLRATLEWEDFCHLGDEARFVADLLRGALKGRERGVNVLLYGQPGTGKTEFCKTLAEKLCIEIFAIGEADESGDPPSTGSRLAAIRLGQRLLGRSASSVLMVDEAEDLLQPQASDPLNALAFFPRTMRHTTARVFLHRLLENNPAPMIWICNDIRGVDPAVLRRFGYVLEICPPSRRSRQRVWERSLARHELGDSEELARRCAEIPVTPGVAGQAIRSACIAGRGAYAVEHVTRQLGRVVTGKPLPGSSRDELVFNIDLVCCDEDIAALTDRLAQMSDRRFSLCVEGPPGTGKSGWIRYLARHMDMEVEVKRASDLLSMYVGGTEAKIAGAFAHAQSAGAFLVFDEADSLLQDRRSAHRSWETTQVNEMLTWMESHPLPFACTTNLIEVFDPAAMRRFTIKLRFDYLRPEQVRSAFRLFFGLDWPLADMPELLAPGDFAAVRRRARIQGMDCPETLAIWLKAECEHKPERRRTIGFTARVACGG